MPFAMYAAQVNVMSTIVRLWLAASQPITVNKGKGIRIQSIPLFRFWNSCCRTLHFSIVRGSRRRPHYLRCSRSVLHDFLDGCFIFFLTSGLWVLYSMTPSNLCGVVCVECLLRANRLSGV